MIRNLNLNCERIIQIFPNTYKKITIFCLKLYIEQNYFTLIPIYTTFQQIHITMFSHLAITVKNCSYNQSCRIPGRAFSPHAELKQKKFETSSHPLQTPRKAISYCRYSFSSIVSISTVYNYIRTRAARLKPPRAQIAIIYISAPSSLLIKINESSQPSETKKNESRIILKVQFLSRALV